MTPRTTTTGSRLSIAANNGDIGGGEVMQLLIAEAAAEADVETIVVGPATPGELVTAARRRGLATVAIPGQDRRAYMRNLRRWDAAERAGLLWCNGLVPALACAGHRNRVVHLHQRPAGPQRAATMLAVAGARRVVVPSAAMGRAIPRATVLTNWTAEPASISHPRRSDTTALIGFMGRFTQDKGLHVLAETIRILDLESPGSVRLVLAGDGRFGSRQDAVVVGAALDRIDHLVTRMGWVPRETFFSAVDLAVFPSVWAEPFGLVAAEAMAARTPYVVTDAGALPEVAGPDHPWIARGGSAQDLAGVLRKALGATDEQRERAVASARQRWERCFSPPAGQRRLATLLTQLGTTVSPR